MFQINFEMEQIRTIKNKTSALGLVDTEDEAGIK
jgi:hypothetical protein